MAGDWVVVSVLQPLGVGALLSFAVEQGLKPVPRLLRRPLHAYAVHLAMWVVAFSLVLAVTWRPWFAASLVLAELLFIVLVSNAKQRSLREPFVFADLEYFLDAIRHPRLFLPYFDWRSAGLTVGVFALVLYLGFVLEPALPESLGYATFFVTVAILLVVGATLLWIGIPRCPAVTFDAEKDLCRCGLPACLWYYAIAERKAIYLAMDSPFVMTHSATAPQSLPHVVVVQSESYFDARRLYPHVRSELFEQFDSVRRTALQYGLLQVPAWGGNTARTEFAFLSGLRPGQLGVHRFNPHRRLARQPLPSLAHAFKGAGFGTVCVHPYPMGFNARDIVYPGLGFDRFIDLNEFSTANRYGPYVSDAAVTDRVCALLDAAVQPLLIFVITMENHGPLHLERPDLGDAEKFYSVPPRVGFDDLTVYLRHLANANRMIGTLRSSLESGTRGGLLCWYGDHVPILPRIYREAGFSDGRTDYFVWRTGADVSAQRQIDLSVEALGHVLLEHVGELSKGVMRDGY